MQAIQKYKAIFFKKGNSGTEGTVQVVQRLSSKHKTWSSLPSTTKKKMVNVCETHQRICMGHKDVKPPPDSLADSPLHLSAPEAQGPI
jgi:hypothetical protein